MRLFSLILLIGILAFSMGSEFGKMITKSRAYIPDWTGRLPYRQFFKEVRGTDSPIKDIRVKNWTLEVETEDGNEDIVLLAIKYR